MCLNKLFLQLNLKTVESNFLKEYWNLRQIPILIPLDHSFDRFDQVSTLKVWIVVTVFELLSVRSLWYLLFIYSQCFRECLCLIILYIIKLCILFLDVSCLSYEVMVIWADLELF